MAGSKLAASRSILYYEPDRTDYAITAAELHRLKEGGGGPWKDICLASASFLLAAVPNVVGGIVAQETFHVTMGLFLNSLAAGISLFATAAFGFAWRRASQQHKLFLKQLASKPRVILHADSLELEAESTNEVAKTLG